MTIRPGSFRSLCFSGPGSAATGTRLLVSLGITGLLLTGCSTAVPVAPAASPGEDQQVIQQACTVMVSELKTAGLSFADLVPKDLSTVDGALLAQAYDTGAASLDRAGPQVADVRVGDVIDTVTSTMRRLAPLAEAAAGGDPRALLEASGPLSDLGGIAFSCAASAL